MMYGTRRTFLHSGFVGGVTLASATRNAWATAPERFSTGSLDLVESPRRDGGEGRGVGLAQMFGSEIEG